MRTYRHITLLTLDNQGMISPLIAMALLGMCLFVTGTAVKHSLTVKNRIQQRAMVTLRARTEFERLQNISWTSTELDPGVHVSGDSLVKWTIFDINSRLKQIQITWNEPRSAFNNLLAFEGFRYDDF